MDSPKLDYSPINYSKSADLNMVFTRQKSHQAYGLMKNIYIQFTLVVDEFGIQYNNKQYFQYLIKSLQSQQQEALVDWKGELFSGVIIKWNYNNQTVDLSMPTYVEKYYTDSNTKTLTTLFNQPYKYVLPK